MKKGLKPNSFLLEMRRCRIALPAVNAGKPVAVNTRNGLNGQEREMITFCFILAQGGCENQLRGHTAGNFGVGNDKEKLYSVVEQCMPYIGYPRSLKAMNIIDEVSKKMENQ